jgi:hypothetical protein
MITQTNPIQETNKTKVFKDKTKVFKDKTNILTINKTKVLITNKTNILIRDKIKVLITNKTKPPRKELKMFKTISIEVKIFLN